MDGAASLAGSRRRAALVPLLSRALARSAGLGGPRALALAATAGVVGVAVAARGGGGDVVVARLAHAVLAPGVALAGAWGALRLSRAPAEDAQARALAALAALAALRGHDAAAFARAVPLAAALALARAVAAPLAVAIVVASATARHPSAASAAAALGAAAWCILAAATLGAIAGACREAAGARGRGAWLAVVIGPWLVAGALAPPDAAAWLSVPGGLGRALDLLVGAPCIVELRRAIAREPGAPPVTLALDAGVHALVGAESDGTLAIASLVAGLSPARGGTVRVGGRDPSRDPATRARIGAALRTPRLPREGTVARLLDAAGAMRGLPLGDAIAALGRPALAARPLASLSREEARAVELAIALATPAPLALVVVDVDEAFAAVDAAAARERVEAAARGGACVMLLGSSPAEAAEHAPVVQLLDRGRVAWSVAARDALGLAPGRGLELRVVTDAPRAMLAALAAEAAVESVAWDAARDASTIAARGRDLDQVAAAIARAALATRARVSSITPVVPTLEEVRAAAAGAALAAWNAAIAARGEGAVSVALGFASARARLGGRAAMRLFVGWLAVALVAVAERRASASGAASRALAGGAMGLATPLVATWIAARAAGGARPGEGPDAWARFGASRRALALGAWLAAATAAAVFGAGAGALAAALGHGPGAPPLAADVATSAWIGALAGVAYASLATLGARGVGRATLLAVDLAAGSTTSAIAALTPRAHVRNLLGGAPPIELAQPASVVALVALSAVALGLALLRTRR